MKKITIADIQTPAFLFDEKQLATDLSIVQKVCNDTNVKLLYAVKSNGFSKLIEYLSDKIDGFAVSSLNETKYIQELTSQSPHLTATDISLTTPGFHHNREAEYLMTHCTSISFNSIPQFKLYAGEQDKYNFQAHLRINPKMELVQDKPFDPSGFPSKLGVDIDQIKGEKPIKGLHGLHIHVGCDLIDFTGLYVTVQKMHKLVPRYLSEAQVFNLGGGWLYRENSDFGPFYQTIEFLNKKYPDLCLMIEPGATLSRRFGSLEFSVIDLFRSSGVNFATVDTSCNHLPEVYEYKFHQKLEQESIEGDHEYLLAGLSCLRGDNFGTYKFNRPLKIGDRLRFIECGAYSVVKMNNWNGIREADLYWVKEDGDLELVKRYGYESFKHRWI